MKKKLKLNELSVQSFITGGTDRIRGGSNTQTLTLTRDELCNDTILCFQAVPTTETHLTHCVCPDTAPVKCVTYLCMVG